MGIYDRDYVKAPPPSGGFSGRVARGGGFPLIGGSIVTTLIVINVAVYFLAGLSFSLGEVIYGFGVLQADLVMRGQVWRLITAQYLHDPSGLGHLLINMLVLHFLGRPLEGRWTPKRFLAFYTMAGLVGNIFYTILGSRGWIAPDMPAVGASGCIFGLLGVIAVLNPNATVYIYFLFPLKIRTAALIFGGIAAWSVLTRGSNFGGEACHLAGLLYGAWWAKSGEAWWASTEWRVPAFLKGKSRGVSAGKAAPGYLRPGRFADRVGQRRIDQAEIDRILKKVGDGGVHTLTEAEKKTLEEETRRQRAQDARAGRVDRL